MDRLKRGLVLVAALAAASTAAGQAPAGKPIAYPGKGQTQAQQQTDDGHCYAWARSNTGVDPSAVAPTGPTGSTVGSGNRARGAVGGAVIGGIANGSDGARTGAAVGIVAGGIRARQNQRAQQASVQADYQGSLNTYYRAWGACMESRGYTIR